MEWIEKPINLAEYILTSFMTLLAIQLASQLLPPSGIFLGTPFILPYFIWKSGKRLVPTVFPKYKFELVLIVVLCFTLMSETMDWYLAPGCHDNGGVAFMWLFTMLSSVFLFSLSVADVLKKRKLTKRTPWTLILLGVVLLVLPLTNHNFLNTYGNDQMGKCNKTIWEYLYNLIV